MAVVDKKINVSLGMRRVPYRRKEPSMKFAHSTDDKRDIILETKGEMLIPENNITIQYVNTPSFTGRNVLIIEIAAIIGKSPDTVRFAIREGIFRFGFAIQSEKSGSYSYYCPDKKGMGRSRVF